MSCEKVTQSHKMLIASHKKLKISHKKLKESYKSLEKENEQLKSIIIKLLLEKESKVLEKKSGVSCKAQKKGSSVQKKSQKTKLPVQKKPEEIRVSMDTELPSTSLPPKIKEEDKKLKETLDRELEEIAYCIRNRMPFQLYPLILARKCEASPFWEGVFPLDIFRVILKMC